MAIRCSPVTSPSARRAGVGDGVQADLFAAVRQAHARRVDGVWMCQCGTPLTDADAFMCPPCVERSRAEREQEILRERSRRHVAELQRLAYAVLASAPDWEHARIDSPALHRFPIDLQRWTRSYSTGSATILGPSGAGKTSSVLAMLRRLGDEAMARERARRSWEIAAETRRLGEAVWTTGHAIARARKQHGLGDDEAPPIRQAMRASLLIIDELGFEPLTEALFEVIDTRYTRRRPTIVTSGLTAEQFMARYGVAMLRRLTDEGVGQLLDVHE